MTPGRTQGSGATLALFGRTTEGTRSLLIGDRVDGLREAISAYGGAAITLVPPAEDPPGPGSSGSFDSVFVVGSLPLLAGRCFPGRDTRAAQKALMRTCREALKPGGLLVLAVPNRYGLDRFRAALRLDEATRSEQDPVESGRPASHPTNQLGRGWRDYRWLLRSEGFNPLDTHCPWPSHAHLQHVVPHAETNSWRPVRTQASGWKRRGLALLFRTLRRFRLHLWLLPDFYIVARLGSPEEHQGPGSPWEQVLAEEGVDPDARKHLVLRYRPQSESMLAAVGSSFLKIPLAGHMVERVAREVTAVRKLKPRFGALVPGSARLGGDQGFRYAAFPRIVQDRSLGPEARLEKAFEALFRNSTESPLRDTVAWERITDPALEAIWASMGARDLVASFSFRLGEERVPVGPVHGDLKHSNILARKGEIVIIDWDGFEEPSPLVVDALYAVVNYMVTLRLLDVPPLRRRVRALSLILAGDASVPLLDEIRRLSGDLSLEDAVLLHVLDHASRSRALLSGSSPAPELVRIMRRQLQFCRELLSEEGRMDTDGSSRCRG